MVRLAEDVVVARAADAVEAMKEWGEKVYLLRLPHQEAIDASRKKMRKEATPYPKKGKDEEMKDFTSRENQWRSRNEGPLQQHAARTEKAKKALEQIAAEHPAPATADEIVEAYVKGNLREWGRVMGKVSDELLRRGVFTRAQGAA